jgi:hypothetical protein
MKSKSELRVEALFKTYKQKFTKKLGVKATYDTDLDRVAKKEFGAKWGGIYAVDEQFKIINNKYYIINTDTKDGPGEHWVAVYLTAKNLYFYDSFSRNPKKITPLLVKRFQHRHIISSDQKDQEQRGLSEVCGVLCLSWIKVAIDLGIKQALKI